MRTFAQKPKTSQQTTSAISTKPSRPFFGQSHELNSFFHLQHTIGNQAVQRLLRTNADERKANSITKASPRLLHDFSRIAVCSKVHTDAIQRHRANGKHAIQRLFRSPVDYIYAPPERPTSRESTPVVYPATLRDFNNHGQSGGRFSCTEPTMAIQTQLGVHPRGRLLNAVELVFYIIDFESLPYEEYRLQRTLEEKVWQQVHGNWELASSTPSGTLDTPAAVCLQLPIISDVDTPGFWVSPDSPVLPLFGSGTTHEAANRVRLRQNFLQWVEGRRGDEWVRISSKFQWHNFVDLERNGSPRRWGSAGDSSIETGHLAL